MDVLKKYIVPARIRTTDQAACSLITVTTGSDSTGLRMSGKPLGYITVVNATATLHPKVCLLNCLLRLRRDKGLCIDVHTQRNYCLCYVCTERICYMSYVYIVPNYHVSYVYIESNYSTCCIYEVKFLCPYTVNLLCILCPYRVKLLYTLRLYNSNIYVCVYIESNYSICYIYEVKFLCPYTVNLLCILRPYRVKLLYTMRLYRFTYLCLCLHRVKLLYVVYMKSNFYVHMQSSYYAYYVHIGSNYYIHCVYIIQISMFVST